MAGAHGRRSASASSAATRSAAPSAPAWPSRARRLFRGATWFLTPGGRGAAGPVRAAFTAWSRRSAPGPSAIDPRRPRPPDGARVAPAPRAGRGAGQPGGGDRARGARGAALGRAVVRRPDPRGRVEPAAVGRHPARQPRGGARRRCAPTSGRLDEVGDALAREDRDWLLGFVGDAAGGPHPPADPGRRRPGGAGARGGGGAEPAGRDLRDRDGPRPRAHQHRGPPACAPGRPDGEGELELLVDGPDAAARGRAPGGAHGFSRSGAGRPPPPEPGRPGRPAPPGCPSSSAACA